MDKLYWVWLSLLPGFSYKKTVSIIEKFGNPKVLWDSKEKELMNSGIFNEKDMEFIKVKEYKAKAEEAMKIIQNNNIMAITYVENEYPEYLKNIFNPPAVLYARGKLKPESIHVGVVGARTASGYGEAAAYSLSKEMGQKGISVVSGMARGIDSCAHKGCLDGGGHTIAVLGCGIDIVYPPENAGLYERICITGAVVSEHPPGIKPLSFNFPARNRIISGLSSGVIIVEASVKSGSLITAAYALEQGREVMAVPGNINNPKSIGTNRLIREGASAVTCLKDILEDLELTTLIEGKSKRKGNSLSDLDLCLEEKLIMKCLSQGEQCFDELIEKTSIGVGMINSFLLMLQMKGYIEQKPGGIFKSIFLV
jgi:DNA processing protein